MLLPSADSNEWAELSVQQSQLGGYGVFPCKGGKALNWSDVSSIQVLLPYLGVETVVKDAHLLKILVEILKGNFERVMLSELQARHGGGRAYVADGLFAVPRSVPSQKQLSPDVQLLQVKAGDDDALAYSSMSRGGAPATAPLVDAHARSSQSAL